MLKLEIIGNYQLSINNYQLSMYYLLYGENSFFSHQKLQQIKNKFLEKNSSGVNLLIFDNSDFNISDFKQSFFSNSLWQEKKLIIMKNIISSIDVEIQEKILKILEENEKNTDIVAIFWEKDNIRKNNKLFKYLNKPQMAQEFKNLSPLQIRKWIEDEFIKHGNCAESQTIDLLSISHKDLQSIYNEIQKLSLFSHNSKNNASFRDEKLPLYKQEIANKRISAEDFYLLANPEATPNIFDFVDAIAYKNKKNIWILVSQFEQKEEDIGNYLFSMLVYLFRNLILIQDCSKNKLNSGLIAKKLGLHPFVVKKSLAQLSNFTPEDLKKIYSNLLNIDIQVKTGKIIPKLALDIMICDLII